MRQLILLALAASAVQVMAQSTRKPAAFSVVEATIPDMQRAMKEHRVTSRELVTQYLTRIALYDKRINAAITIKNRNGRMVRMLDLRSTSRPGWPGRHPPDADQ